MAEYEVLSMKDSGKWSNLLRQIPNFQQDIYYTPEYYSLYEELGDGKANCFTFKKGNEIALYPYLINSVNAFGYELDLEYFDIQGAYGYNGVISNSTNQDFIDGFYKEFNRYCRNENIIAEFTRFHPLFGNEFFSKNNFEVIFERKTVYIDLNKSYESLFMGYQKTTRKQIRRASNRYNIRLQLFENDISILDDFLFIYNESMKRVNALPYLYFNKDYFKSLLKIKGCYCLFAFYNNKPIAAATFFHWGPYIQGHLGGSLTDYMAFAPFSLIYDQLIKFGQSKSCRFLHVGGGATNNDEDSLLKYKMNFSDTSREFLIGKKIHNQNIYYEVIGQWIKRNPVSNSIENKMLLKYRT